eukprot:COSAG05_NODE_23344_length_258_cov_1.591195_1_plen_74_part_01
MNCAVAVVAVVAVQAEVRVTVNGSVGVLAEKITAVASSLLSGGGGETPRSPSPALTSFTPVPKVGASAGEGGIV